MCFKTILILTTALLKHAKLKLYISLNYNIYEQMFSCNIVFKLASFLTLNWIHWNQMPFLPVVLLDARQNMLALTKHTVRIF